METYEFVKQVHSILRYFVFALLIINIVKCLMGWVGRRDYEAIDKRLSLYLLITTHTQLLLGLILYGWWASVSGAFNDMGTTMKSPALRFIAVEHITMMLLAVAFITIGHVRAKRLLDYTAKFKNATIFFTLAFILIMVGARNWFWQ
ncbi:MAG: hypothetical protein SFW35_08865 [Chitinophagales bacterium]|nr:hypothetical protein [Chitinophagales bacterium]